MLGNRDKLDQAFPTDAEKGLDLLLWAAEQGDQSAMRALASHYRSGPTEDRDPVAVLAWTTRAAEAGNLFAMVQVGQIHETGDGVPPDPVAAVRWYRTAAEAGDQFGEFNLGRAYDIGLGVPQSYARAAEWYSRTKVSKAQLRLGEMYLEGRGVPQSYAKAAEAFENASGYLIAKYNLAVLYHNGYGVPKDRARAEHLFDQAARRGIPEAKAVMAEIVKRRNAAAKKRPLTEGEALALMVIKGILRAGTAPATTSQNDADFQRQQAHIKRQQQSSMDHATVGLLLLP
ncbi:sel1 repeat family protein [Rhodobacteraceae bacterium CCMM004]|nr:sel1 repeat family protein [Rhodobacteraceae bacterium CCMM004]